jgi:hypothetical protein
MSAHQYDSGMFFLHNRARATARCRFGGKPEERRPMEGPQHTATEPDDGPGPRLVRPYVAAAGGGGTIPPPDAPGHAPGTPAAFARGTAGKVATDTEPGAAAGPSAAPAPENAAGSEAESGAGETLAGGPATLRLPAVKDEPPADAEAAAATGGAIAGAGAAAGGVNAATAGAASGAGAPPAPAPPAAGLPRRGRSTRPVLYAAGALGACLLAALIVVRSGGGGTSHLADSPGGDLGDVPTTSASAATSPHATAHHSAPAPVGTTLAGSPTASATASATPSRSASPRGGTAAAPHSSAASPSASSRSASPSAGTSTAPRTLRYGDRGPDVTALQRRLAEANLFGSKPNGVYDGETYGGVAGYQTRHGITSDPIGVYGPATRAALEKEYP